MKLEERMLRSIKQRAGNVVIRADIARLGSPSQVTVALKALCDKGVLFRIGTGVYAKTRKSSITGATIPAGSLETLASEAFKKLGVSVSAGSAAAAYNSGRTTQLPGTIVVDTGPRRISRKIAVGGRTVEYENNYRSQRSQDIKRPRGADQKLYHKAARRLAQKARAIEVDIDEL